MMVGVIKIIYFAYILQCWRNGQYWYYKGMTNNIKRRYGEHKKGRCKYTKRYDGNLNIIYIEEIEGRSKKECFSRARKRENQLKRWSRTRVEKVSELKRLKTADIIHKYIDSITTIPITVKNKTRNIESNLIKRRSRMVDI